MATPIEQRYIDMHPRSAEFYATSREVFANGVTHDGRNLKPFPIFCSHGLKAHKWDVDGHRIIDYWTGHGALILGHSHPDIVAAVTEQMSIGTHLSSSTELEIRWAQLICDLVPCGEKVRFHASGTEATMMALTLARAYTGKTKIVKFENHFHGWADYVKAGVSPLGGIPKETLSTVIVLPHNDISLVEKTLQEDSNVAAVILEPTGAHMGQYPLKPSFLSELRDVTRRYGVVLIFDEVVTGFRTARGGAQEYFGVTPDLATLGKIVGGGLPAAAVTGKADIIDMIQLRDDPEFNSTQRVAHNGTYNGNPLSAAAGVKALELVATTPVNDTVNAKGDRLKAGFNELLTRMEVPGYASGVGSVIFLRLGIEPDGDRESHILSPEEQRIADNPARTNKLVLGLLNHGVHSTARFILSAAHTEQDIDETVAATGEVLAELREQGMV